LELGGSPFRGLLNPRVIHIVYPGFLYSSFDLRTMSGL
jgi:hypothetical protein